VHNCMSVSLVMFGSSLMDFVVLRFTHRPSAVVRDKLLYPSALNLTIM